MEHISKLQKRLEFIVTINIFSLTVLQSFFESSVDYINQKNIIPYWGFLIAFLLFDYLLVCLGQNKINDSMFKFLDKILLIDILVTGITFVFFAELIRPISTDWFAYCFFKICFISILIIPIFIFLFLFS
jgi:hypothetical protein